MNLKYNKDIIISNINVEKDCICFDFGYKDEVEFKIKTSYCYGIGREFGDRVENKLVTSNPSSVVNVRVRFDDKKNFNFLFLEVIEVKNINNDYGPYIIDLKQKKVITQEEYKSIYKEKNKKSSRRVLN